MNISEINGKVAELSTGIAFKSSSIKKYSDLEESNTKDKSSEMNSWQKDILLDAISMLENNKQVDNSHPLDNISALPIETFEEALIELSYIHSSRFKEEALGAQANLKPEDILYLFTVES